MRKFILYCIGGSVAVLVHYTVLFALVEWANVVPLYASMLGFMAAIPVNFGFQSFLVFKEVDDFALRFARYCVVTLSTFCLNAALFYTFTDVVGLHYLLAQAVTILLVLLVNFSANSSWTFKRTGSEA